MSAATLFFDMSSGGSEKLDWRRIIIEAGKYEAIGIFQSIFDRDPQNITCGCCGEDYVIDEYKSISEAKKHYDFDHGSCKVITKKDMKK